MKVSIENIGKFQDQFLLGIKKGEEIWSCERNLKFVLENVFPKQQIFQNKKIVLDGKTYFPDYRIEPLKIIVEFQGYQHFTNSKIVYSDSIRSQHFESIGYTFIEFPYFVQLTPNVLNYIFKDFISEPITKDFSNGFPHGFIHPKAALIGDFCKLGLIKTDMILTMLHSEVRESCYKSLEVRSNMDGIPTYVYNSLL